MKKITLKAEKRDPEKTKNRELRKKKLMPAILYGHKAKNQPLTLSYQRFEEVYGQTGSSSLIDLQVEKGKSVKVIIHEVQFNPVTDRIVHADFYRIKMSEKIKTEIPLNFINKSPAVEEEGGNLIIDKEKIEIECLPQDLVSEIEVDISPLKTFDDVIRVENLNIPKKIEVLGEGNEVVATTTPPRSKEEMEALEEAPEESDIEKIEVEGEKEEETEEDEEEKEEEKLQRPEGSESRPQNASGKSQAKKEEKKEN